MLDSKISVNRLAVERIVAFWFLLISFVLSAFYISRYHQEKHEHRITKAFLDTGEKECSKFIEQKDTEIAGYEIACKDWQKLHKNTAERAMHWRQRAVYLNKFAPEGEWEKSAEVYPLKTEPIE
jgi:hypothetical protein